MSDKKPKVLLEEFRVKVKIRVSKLINFYSRNTLLFIYKHIISDLQCKIFESILKYVVDKNNY